MGAEARADAATGELERFGRYEIVHKLASGGMGEVFLARSVGAAGFQKHVVIKKLLPHLVEQVQFVEGLIREAKLLVRLDHPNIVQVLDLGIEGSDYFMAMEYVHGYNLATIIHYCAQTHLVIPAPVCAVVCTQVLAGLGYAHTLSGPDGLTQNVVHRDVSPQNVLISTEGRVKLTDFGIAKVLNEAEGEFTQSLKGKFRYMAPEVVEGGRIDHRYDLFAVGILLFESLCRRHLFSGNNDVNILSQVRKAHVPPISRYHPEAPRALNVVTEKALSKDPGLRYQTAMEFASALRQAIGPISEDEALGQLRSFITELYARPDFPLNKPKLPELGGVSVSMTRSLVLRSRIEPAAIAVQPAASPKRRWLVLGAIVLALAGGAVVLVTRLTKPSIVFINSYPKLDASHRRPSPDMTPIADAPRAPDARLPRGPRVTCAAEFTQRMGEASLHKAEGKLKVCLSKYAPDSELVLRIITTIAGSGKVKAVKLEPAALETTPLGRCLAGVANRIKYPCHKGGEVDFKVPLRVERRL